MNEGGNWDNELRFISMIKGNNSKQNYSKAHLTLLAKLGLDIDISQCEQLAGNTEPSIRMVVRD